jgi:transposase
LVHHAALTAYHKDHLAKNCPEDAHGYLANARLQLMASQPARILVPRRSSMSTATVLDRIGVGIDTARYGHRVSFLRPDRQPAAKPLTVLENQAGYQALQQRLQQLRLQHPQAQFHVRIDAAGQYAVNLEAFLRGLDLPLTISIGEPKRNKDYQKAHFPKRTTDDTESQAMARFAVVELPDASPTSPPQMLLLREVAGRLQAQVRQTTQAINRLHNLMARVFPELATLADDFSARWLLSLLDKYPSAARIAQARLTSLEKIPYLPKDLAEPLHQAAQQSVGSLRGAVAEALVSDLVAQVRHCDKTEQTTRDLLAAAFADLPVSGHVQVVTIPGIGTATAAVLTAKIIDINRFDTPEQLVGYFGTFPEENTSGVDKQGNPIPPGTLRMSHKGNDLVRSYLWNAARTAIRCNPAVRALYRRLKAKGKRGDVAIGHCMCKLLHLVFAVWKTNRPFDPKHFPWEDPSATAVPTNAPAAATTVAEPSPSDSQVSAIPMTASAASTTTANEKAVGHKRDVPAPPVVTTASATLEPTPAAVKSTTPVIAAARPSIDFAFLRQQVTLQQVLEHLRLFDQLRGRGAQRRGRCPVHAEPGGSARTFSVHLGKNIFQCFQADCGAHGNALDLWAAVHRLPLYEAAMHLAETFHLPTNREEEPVK